MAGRPPRRPRHRACPGRGGRPPAPRAAPLAAPPPAAPAARNTVSLPLGVAVHRPTVRAALDRAGVELGSVESALKDQGVATADVQTDSLNVSADYTNGSVTGYAASSMVRVTIHHVQN